MANILVQWMMTGIVSLLHPFFVSVIEINHNAKEATVEVSVRVFSEDLEKTLQKYSKVPFDILNPSDKVYLDQQISRYLTQNIQFRINGQPVTLMYLGHEIQKESVWSYFEVPKVVDMKKLEVNCTLLYDFEKLQSNIFHVKSRNIEKSFKLDYPRDKVVFVFQ